MLSLMTRMPQIVLDPHSVTDRRRRPKILFCPIQSHALQGLHILRSPISRPRILRPCCPDLVLFLGFRVDFFFPFMHDIQDCTSLNQPGIIRNFSQKKLPCSKWMLTLHICSFFPLTSEISSSQSLHPRIIHYLELTNNFGKFSSIRN